MNASVMIRTLLACAVLGSHSGAALAKVDAEQAARLKGDLTPMGAVRAGNADGSIPEWTGGLDKIPEGIGYKGKGDFHPDPYADEAPLYTVDASNMAQYADQLSKGAQMLMKRHPTTFKVNVYPTHRSAAAPQWVYDHTFNNATRVETTKDGMGIEANGGRLGIPFPIPTRPEEYMWNHNLAYNGGAFEGEIRYAVVQASGTKSVTGTNWSLKTPWYDANTTTDSPFSYFMRVSLAASSYPPKTKGNIALSRDPINQMSNPREAWAYLAGQRRVRRAPTIAYDTPADSSNGIAVYDDLFTFNGSLDRYEWKFLGTKEMLIPYNNYKTDLVPMDELLTPHHFNPESVRWEKHRVHVIEATLKPTARHAYGKRIFYIDEDSWGAAMADNFDGRGELWRFYMTTRKVAYEVPATVTGVQFGFDFLRPDYFAGYMVNDLERMPVFDEPRPDDYFTPNNMRKLGLR